VLGGFALVHDKDIRSNFEFIDKCSKLVNFKNGRALDCGAGIGRVTKAFLIKKFEVVDLVE